MWLSFTSEFFFTSFKKRAFFLIRFFETRQDKTATNLYWWIILDVFAYAKKKKGV